MKKNIQVKKYSRMVSGECPGVNVRGICAEIKALLNKFRSPIGFAKGKGKPC